MLAHGCESAGIFINLICTPALPHVFRGTSAVASDSPAACPARGGWIGGFLLPVVTRGYGEPSTVRHPIESAGFLIMFTAKSAGWIPRSAARAHDLGDSTVVVSAVGAVGTGEDA